MPGFGIMKKLTGRKTLGRRNRRMQDEEEDDFMGLGFIDSLIETRFDVTDTTGIIGTRWKKGESMIGKFMNKAPEPWPPEPAPEEPMGRRRQSANRQRDLDEARARRLQEGREQLPDSYEDQIALEPSLLMI